MHPLDKFFLLPLPPLHRGTFTSITGYMLHATTVHLLQLGSIDPEQPCRKRSYAVWPNLYPTPFPPASSTVALYTYLVDKQCPLRQEEGRAK